MNKFPTADITCTRQGFITSDTLTLGKLQNSSKVYHTINNRIQLSILQNNFVGLVMKWNKSS
jgi:hypothetical protein